MRSALGVISVPHIGEQRHDIDVCERDVRELLRSLRRPFLLEQNRLAQLLRQAYGVASPIEALQAMIREAIADSPAFGNIYSEIIQRCDVRAESTKQAAVAMNMSIRTFFRFRKDALMIVALTVSRRIRAANGPSPRSRTPHCPMHGAQAS